MRVVLSFVSVFIGFCFSPPFVCPRSFWKVDVSADDSGRSSRSRWFHFSVFFSEGKKRLGLEVLRSIYQAPDVFLNISVGLTLQKLVPETDKVETAQTSRPRIFF